MRKSTIIFRCAADDCDQEVEAHFTFQDDIIDPTSASWNLPEGWHEDKFGDEWIVCCKDHEVDHDPRLIRKEAPRGLL